MTLKDYLNQNRLSLKTFADRCGVSAPTILRARDRSKHPSIKTIRAIIAATNGAVTVQDLIVVETQEDRNGR